MKKYIPASVISTLLFIIPTVAFAETKSLKDLACLGLGYAGLALYVIVTLAVVVFVWNIYRYFIVADPKNKKEAGLYVMYSVMGFVVILSLWGLVYIVTNSLNIQNTSASYWSVFPSAATCSNTNSSTYVPYPNNSGTTAPFPTNSGTTPSRPTNSGTTVPFPVNSGTTAPSPSNTVNVIPNM